VNSPVRAFGGVGGDPLFIKRGEGAYLIDVDDNRYIDYVGSWGPLILGHAHPYVLQKVTECAANGFTFGAPTAIEVTLAKKVCELMPSIQKVRFVSSGTEAAMSAIRLARGYTKRHKIIKFIGCYHGHSDALLVSAGSGALTFGVPSSAGVPASVVEHTLLADFNNLEQVEALFKQHGDDIAAVMVEPVAANVNLILPHPAFLQGLRKLCDQYKSLLVFDEVITGFRVALGGAQAYYNVVPDITVLGKIVGGGFPAAAFGGREDIMNCLAPLGTVYQAGTLSGNPIAMTAGLATLDIISQDGFYDALAKKTHTLTTALKKVAAGAGVALHIESITSLFGLFFTTETVIQNEKDVKRCDVELYKRFFHGMLLEGVYLAPSAFEVGFMSAAHDENAIELTIAAAKKVFSQIK
jgi:glutamate-1-semialdehyde 2,1-aminomutase